MRATRGLLASLGASTSLVLATAMALFSVSTIVAFKGWPGMGSSVASSGDQQLAVSVAEPGGGPEAERAQRIVVPRAPSRQRREAASPPRRGGLTTRAVSVPIVASRPRSIVRRHISASARAPAPAAAPPASTTRPKRSVPVPGDPVREVGTGLGGAVGGVAGGLGEAVRPVSPALGRTLDQAGRSLDQTIRGVTGAVGTVLDRLLAGSIAG